MILEVAGYVLKNELAIHAVTDAPVKAGVLFAARPHHVIPLEEAGWPAETVSRIIKAYVAVGLQNPLKQKLVEPRAIVFGGKYNEGVANLSDVNWDMVGDYFEWEAQAVAGTYEMSCKLQDQAEKKWNMCWSHYEVYEDYISRS